MKSKKITKKYIDFDSYRRQMLKDPKIKKYYDEEGKKLEIAYQILMLRKKHRISQKQLARKIGTTQSNIARMESGQQNFSTETLYKVANAFGRELKVEFVGSKR